MPKKSRRVAATYAMKSKTKKAPARPNIVIQYPSDAEIPEIASADKTVQEESFDYSSYRYVVSDLRRMGLLIGVLIVAMVVLTIFLR
jgi:hypothetical protein